MILKYKSKDSVCEKQVENLTWTR